jgi:hypothetical protein
MNGTKTNQRCIYCSVLSKIIAKHLSKTKYKKKIAWKNGKKEG